MDSTSLDRGLLAARNISQLKSRPASMMQYDSTTKKWVAVSPATPPAPIAVPLTATLRVLTLNFWISDIEIESRVAAFVALLKTLSVDVVCLQEMTPLSWSLLQRYVTGAGAGAGAGAGSGEWLTSDFPAHQTSTYKTGVICRRPFVPSAVMIMDNALCSRKTVSAIFEFTAAATGTATATTATGTGTGSGSGGGDNKTKSALIRFCVSSVHWLSSAIQVEERQIQMAVLASKVSGVERSLRLRVCSNISVHSL